MHYPISTAQLDIRTNIIRDSITMKRRFYQMHRHQCSSIPRCSSSSTQFQAISENHRERKETTRRFSSQLLYLKNTQLERVKPRSVRSTDWRRENSWHSGQVGVFGFGRQRHQPRRQLLQRRQRWRLRMDGRMLHVRWCEGELWAEKTRMGTEVKPSCTTTACTYYDLFFRFP